jgi:hypothetical protein
MNTLRKLTPSPRILFVLCLLAVAAYGAWAQTASNTVPANRIGSGSATVSGYTISNVVWNQNATTPTDVDSLTFDISPASATDVRVQLESGGSWYSCTNTAGAVTCNTTSPQATAVAPTQLTVTATE